MSSISGPESRVESFGTKLLVQKFFMKYAADIATQMKSLMLVKNQQVHKLLISHNEQKFQIVF